MNILGGIVGGIAGGLLDKVCGSSQLGLAGTLAGWGTASPGSLLSQISTIGAGSNGGGESLLASLVADGGENAANVGSLANLATLLGA